MNSHKFLVLMVIGMTGLVVTVRAQDTNADTTATAQPSSAAVAAPAVAAPQLPYGAGQILQLVQAKVGDDTIVAYIRNSGNSYNLSAEQIIYLQQQGLSSTVVNAMLTQPKAGLAGYPAPAAPAPAPVYNAPPPDDSQQPPAPASTVTVGPAVTAIDPTAAAAASSYYYQPYYYPAYGYPYYYPAYGWYPGVSVSLGWGRGWGGHGWHGGGGFHGGWHR